MLRTQDSVTLPSIDHRARIPERLLYLAAGVPIAFLLSSLSFPLLSYMGWFVTALVHELGHTLSAIFFGSLAFPAISLDGHAAAFHQEQNLLAAIFVWAALAALAWRLRGHRPLLVAFSIATALYPLFAFTGLRDVVHLAAGHLMELGFATWFLRQALVGGFTRSPAERSMHSGLGLLWTGGNVLLFESLILSAESRQWYLSNGSFGMENDFVRLAAKLQVSIPTVAAPMLLLALMVPVVAWFSCRDLPASS